MECPTEALSEVAKTVTKVTSASPIISAVAVRAVRCGLRIAFCWPRRPGTPAKRAAGAPQDPRERARDQRREHGEADEDHQHARAEEREDLAGLAAAQGEADERRPRRRSRRRR